MTNIVITIGAITTALLITILFEIGNVANNTHSINNHLEDIQNKLDDIIK